MLTVTDKSEIYHQWKHSSYESDLIDLFVEAELPSGYDKAEAKKLLESLDAPLISALEYHHRSNRFHELMTMIDTMFYLYDEGFMDVHQRLVPGMTLALINSALKARGDRQYASAEEFAEECRVVQDMLSYTP